MKFDVEKLMLGLRKYITENISLSTSTLQATITTQAATIATLEKRLQELEETESTFEIDEEQLKSAVTNALEDAIVTPNINFDFDGERTLTITVDDETKTFEIPTQIYRGVHVEEQEYVKGDTVTHQGGLWHCKQLTTEKPGESEHWQLAVKSGRK